MKTPRTMKTRILAALLEASLLACLSPAGLEAQDRDPDFDDLVLVPGDGARVRPSPPLPVLPPVVDNVAGPDAETPATAPDPVPAADGVQPASAEPGDETDVIPGSDQPAGDAVVKDAFGDLSDEEIETVRELDPPTFRKLMEAWGSARGDEARKSRVKQAIRDWATGRRLGFYGIAVGLNSVAGAAVGAFFAKNMVSIGASLGVMGAGALLAGALTYAALKPALVKRSHRSFNETLDSILEAGRSTGPVDDSVD